MPRVFCPIFYVYYSGQNKIRIVSAQFVKETETGRAVSVMVSKLHFHLENTWNKPDVRLVNIVYNPRTEIVGLNLFTSAKKRRCRAK